MVAAAGAALIALALVGLQVGILFNELALKGGTQSTADTAQQLLDAADSLNTPFVIVELLAAALLIAWMNRTYQKLPGLGARDLQGSPGGAVGWWFVPLANLYVPFKYLREIWRALTPGLTPNDRISRAKVPGGKIAGALWILAIVSFVLGFAARGAGLKLDTLDDFIRFAAIDATFLASRFGYVLVSIALMLAVQQRQARRFAELQADGAPRPTDA